MSKLLTVERADVPPRDDLLRMAPFALRAEGDPEGDGRTLDGFAAVFNHETIIDSWEGRFREKISSGSMKKSFRETRPKIQYDHGRHPLIGSIPIAAPMDGYPREESDPTLAPDGGARILARLADNWLVEPLRDAIASKSIDGMSFRFSVVREQWFDADGKRIRDEETLRDLLRRTWFEDVAEDELLLRDLKELRVPEMGPVAWPAYGNTSVGVRSKTFTIDLGRLGDPEQRKTLARAVFLADAAERMEAESPQATDDLDEVEAGEHDQPAETNDEPRTTDDPESPAGEHSTDPEPRTTDESAGEHSTDEDEPAFEPARAGRSPAYLGEAADWYLPAPSGGSTW